MVWAPKVFRNPQWYNSFTLAMFSLDFHAQGHHTEPHKHVTNERDSHVM